MLKMVLFVPEVSGRKLASNGAKGRVRNSAVSNDAGADDGSLRSLGGNTFS